MTEEVKQEKQEGMSPAVQKRVLELLRRAEAAYNKHNYRWAAELYGEIYTMDRKKNVEYLQKMIIAALGNKSIAANVILFTVRAVFNNIPHYIKAVKLKDSEDNFTECFEIYETILRNDPDSGFAISALSRLYDRHGFVENAALVLESFMRIRKKDIGTLKKIAELYVKIDEIEKARNCYKRVLDIKPFDQDAEKRLRDLLAMASIDESKLRGAGFQDSIRDKANVYKSQIEMKMNKTTDEIDFLINSKKNEIEQDPKNISLRYELLNYYKEKNDRKNVLHTLEGIVEVSSGDMSVHVDKTEAEIAVYSEEAQARKASGETPAVVERDLNLFRKKVYASLLQSFSTSNEIKFRLGQINMDLGENDEALKLFQACSKVPELAVESWYCMGQVLVRKQMYDMAVDQFTNAAAQIKDMNELKKNLIYHLASTYEKIGKDDFAFEQYKAIYKEDMDFMDVSAKIEAFYKKNQKS